MVLRVTQQMLYGNVISQNNAALSKLMETNNQASTQKRINAPSDDPNGAVQVLSTRTDLSQLTQYQSNMTTATAIAALEDKSVDFYVIGSVTASQTLGGYYSTLVGQVGSDTSSASCQVSYQTALASQLEDQKLSVSGVSLDEELTNLIKFQHAYQAAAKLISTADALFETVLGLKN